MRQRLLSLVMLAVLPGCMGPDQDYPLACMASVPFKPLSRATQTKTGQALDLAITGEGLFELSQQGVNKTFYTRHGEFRLASSGRITTADGRYQLDLAKVGDAYRADPPLVFPSDVKRVTVSPEGLVQIETATGSGLQTFGQVLLSSFPNREGLSEVSPGVYEESCSSGYSVIEPPRAGSQAGTLLIGTLESEAPAGGAGTIGSPKWHVAP